MKINFKNLITVSVIGVAVVAAIFLSVTANSKTNFTVKAQRDAASASTTSVSLDRPANITLESAAGLGAYNVLISDRGNNRIIEVTPDKQIVWEYDFNLPKSGLGADDAFFADGGSSIVANLENYNLIDQIDFATKQITWSYGIPGKASSSPGFLNTPDDSYKLPNGDYTVADIKNCRVLEISPAKDIVRQYGVTKHCGNMAGLLDMPNGDTPVAGGYTLVSNIVSHNVIELDPQWQKVASIALPISYPSDPQLTKDGNILIADYSKPGKIIEVNFQGQPLWSYQGKGQAALNHPSLAIELPNGNILANDDYNHRVVVIDKQSRQIVWQYGMTGQAGRGPNQLNLPDGLDIIATSQTASSSTESSLPIYSVGQVSRHASGFINQAIKINGYVLKAFPNYAIISDEVSGTIGYYDLPVSGFNVASLQTGIKYTFIGTLISEGLSSINNYPKHLELQSPARPVN